MYNTWKASKAMKRVLERSMQVGAYSKWKVGQCTILGKWTQQLEHMQVQKATEPGVWKGKRSLLACPTCCKYSTETSRDSVKVNFGVTVIKWSKVWSVGKSLQLVKLQNGIKHSWEGDFFLFLNKIIVSTIKFPEWRFQAFHDVSLFK